MANDSQFSSTYVSAGLAFLSVVHTLILTTVCDHVKAPYMDEYFHHDQLKAYAEDDKFFYWNDKLTTPPGLYLADLFFVRICRLLGISMSLLNLGRTINTYFYSLATVWVVFKIFNFYYPKTQSINFERALFIHFIPTHFFFHFLLYTDSGSTFFVLLTYFLTLSNRTNLGALAGFAAVLFRQTNIVWVCFICARKYIHDKRHHFLNQDVRLPLHLQATKILERAFHDRWVLLRKFKFYFLLLIGFAGFIFWNKGIVLGDRSNHEASFHPMQLPYFLLFSLPLISIPIYFYFYNLKILVIQITKKPVMIILFVILTVLFALLASKYTITHKFMVADNRHYIFYIWKNFFLKYWYFKYLLCPLYAVAVLLLIPLFISSREKMLVIVLWGLCTAAVLVPAKLIEFRYYTIPLILLQIEIKPFVISNEPPKEDNDGELNAFTGVKYFWARYVIPQIVAFFAFDVLLYYIFLFKPFALPNGETGRFMW